MQKIVYPRYTLVERMILGSVLIVEQILEWLINKCLVKVNKIDRAFFV